MVDEVALEGGSQSAPVRRGDVVVRRASRQAKTVHALLRFLEDLGYAAAPRVVESGFTDDGRETISFVEGKVEHPGPMSRTAAVGVAVALRELHEATRSFVPPHDAYWNPWFLRDLGEPSVIGHCDATPWNVLVLPDRSISLVDWDEAGPVDPMIDFAQTAWTCSNLYSPDVVEMNALAPAGERAATLGAMVDAYGLDAAQRETFVRTMIDFAIHSTAADADDWHVTPEEADHQAAWGLAWRARAASWMLRNRALLEEAVRR